MGEGDMTAPEKVGHSRLPWALCSFSDRHEIRAGRYGDQWLVGKLPAGAEYEYQNAALIVRAVNHHEEMVSVLRHIQKHYSDMIAPGFAIEVDDLLAKLDAEVTP